MTVMPSASGPRNTVCGPTFRRAETGRAPSLSASGSTVQRNLVERFFNKLRQFRGITTRYDRLPENFLAAIELASVRIWLQS